MLHEIIKKANIEESEKQTREVKAEINDLEDGTYEAKITIKTKEDGKQRIEERIILNDSKEDLMIEIEKLKN